MNERPDLLSLPSLLLPSPPRSNPGRMDGRWGRGRSAIRGVSEMNLSGCPVFFVYLVFCKNFCKAHCYVVFFLKFDLRHPVRKSSMLPQEGRNKSWKFISLFYFLRHRQTGRCEWMSCQTAPKNHCSEKRAIFGIGGDGWPKRRRRWRK